MVIKKFGKSLFIFRRDLRLIDNTGLIKACTQSGKVLPGFFLHNDLLDHLSDKFRPNLIQFMYESLVDLNERLKKKRAKLNVFYGNSFFNEFEKVIKVNKIEAVFVNEDYTPYSIKRDYKLKKICLDNNVDFISVPDLLLTKPGEVLTKEGNPYRVFTAFFNTAYGADIKKPEGFTFKKNFSMLKMQ